MGCSLCGRARARPASICSLYAAVAGEDLNFKGKIGKVDTVNNLRKDYVASSVSEEPAFEFIPSGSNPRLRHHMHYPSNTVSGKVEAIYDALEIPIKGLAWPDDNVPSSNIDITSDGKVSSLNVLLT